MKNCISAILSLALIICLVGCFTAACFTVTDNTRFSCRNAVVTDEKAPIYLRVCGPVPQISKTVRDSLCRVLSVTLHANFITSGNDIRLPDDARIGGRAITPAGSLKLLI